MIFHSAVARLAVASGLALTPLHGHATAACVEPAGGAAVLVTVSGFKDRAGQVRVQLYRAVESDFLVSGRYVARVDTPTAPTGEMRVCVPLAEPGAYAVTVLHDRNRSGKLDPFSDGVGFANNPKLRLAKPALAKVTVDLPAGVSHLAVRLNYLRGFRVAPIDDANVAR